MGDSSEVAITGHHQFAFCESIVLTVHNIIERGGRRDEEEGEGGRERKEGKRERKGRVKILWQDTLITT